MEVFVKNSGRVAILEEIARSYKALYPKRAKWFQSKLKKWKEVNKNPDGSWTDPKGRTMFVRVRVPTELWLFIGRHIPDWGQDSNDLKLLAQVWSDLVPAATKKRLNRQALVKDIPNAKKEKEDSSKRGDDSKKLRGGLGEVFKESEGLIRPQ